MANIVMNNRQYGKQTFGDYDNTMPACKHTLANIWGHGMCCVADSCAATDSPGLQMNTRFAKALDEVYTASVARLKGMHDG